MKTSVETKASQIFKESIRVYHAVRKIDLAKEFSI